MAVSLAVAATPNDPQPGQRIDLKVLLVSADGNEPGFGAWKAALDREGVPYDTLVSYSGQTKVATLTDDRLADYAGNHAKYQAVILAAGDLGHAVDNPGGTQSFLSAFTDVEWASLARFEQTFGIRRLSDNTSPSPLHGLNNVPAGAVLDTKPPATLTAAGKAAFPYLKGPIPFPNDAAYDEAFGYEGTPVNAADWQTLVADSTTGASYLGIYTHPEDGREEMVVTMASNQFQPHNQALRHGMLNWVTRGVFLGYQRAYLGLDVDDIFLGDDRWNPDLNVTDYDFANAIRMTRQDVLNAVKWQNARKLKLTMVYNMGGVELYDDVPGGPDLLAAFQQNKSEFPWVNHTLDHPNLDCTTPAYTQSQITTNQNEFNRLIRNPAPALPAALNDPAELVTGEHSGLANTRPGNPGTIDPPAFDDPAVAGTTGTLPAGTYEYGITANSTRGETTASTTQVAVTLGQTVTLTWPSVCHAIAYSVYRRPVDALGVPGAWSRLGTTNVTGTPGAGFTVPSPAFTDAGAADVTFVDNVPAAGGTAASPPAANLAGLEPYPQNPALIPALQGANIRTIASDSSKDYPSPATAPLGGAVFPKGASFVDGPARAVPRYPSNVYYNVANRAHQLDEYNWIYTSPAGGGGCVPITGVTTCNDAPVDWATYLDSETRIMFGHLTGNDPRPHYFHQTNIAESVDGAAITDTTVGGTLYAVIDKLLERYDLVFDRTQAPLVQLTHHQVAGVLAQQEGWQVARGAVTAWLQDGSIHIRNNGTGAVDVPVTGTQEGARYAGQNSGWITIAGQTERKLEPADPLLVAPAALSGTAKVGQTLTVTGATWTGTDPIARRYRWQRCDATRCTTVDGATGTTYAVTAADVDRSLRVVVSAGNWISSVGQAVSEKSDKVPEPPVVPKGEQPGAGGKQGGNGGSGGSGGSGGAGGQGTKGKRKKLALTRVRMSPRRFPVAHRKLRRGTRLDGSTITWRLNRRAKVRLTVQRARGKGAQRRWVKVGALKRAGHAGKNVVRFRGRFGTRLLVPARYRLTVTAKQGRQRSGPARVRFKVVRG